MGVLNRSEDRGPAVEARIRAAIAEMAPLLRIESGEVELVEYRSRTGVAVLRVEGGCPDCEMTAAMLLEGISAHLRGRVPEIREILAVGDGVPNT